MWLDEYKEYYYDRIGHDLGNYGDISSRITLRNQLQCKSFDWYLKNVYPELFIPGESVAHGEVRNLFNEGAHMCLDSPAKKENLNKPVGLYPCHKQVKSSIRPYGKCRVIVYPSSFSYYSISSYDSSILLSVSFSKTRFIIVKPILTPREATSIG